MNINNPKLLFWGILGAGLIFSTQYSTEGNNASSLAEPVPWPPDTIFVSRLESEIYRVSVNEDWPPDTMMVARKERLSGRMRAVLPTRMKDSKASDLPERFMLVKTR